MSGRRYLPLLVSHQGERGPGITEEENALEFPYLVAPK
jgi:hypothetical protein